MFGIEGIGAKTKKLEKQRDRLVEDFKCLEAQLEKGKIDEKTYSQKRREIEREIVEVMDRLAQMRFMSGDG